MEAVLLFEVWDFTSILYVQTLEDLVDKHITRLIYIQSSPVSYPSSSYYSTTGYSMSSSPSVAAPFQFLHNFLSPILGAKT